MRVSQPPVVMSLLVVFISEKKRNGIFNVVGVVSVIMVRNMVPVLFVQFLKKQFARILRVGRCLVCSTW